MNCSTHSTVLKCTFPVRFSKTRMTFLMGYTECRVGLRTLSTQKLIFSDNVISSVAVDFIPTEIKMIWSDCFKPPEQRAETEKGTEIECYILFMEPRVLDQNIGLNVVNSVSADQPISGYFKFMALCFCSFICLCSLRQPGFTYKYIRTQSC